MVRGLVTVAKGGVWGHIQVLIILDPERPVSTQRKTI